MDRIGSLDIERVVGRFLPTVGECNELGIRRSSRLQHGKKLRCEKLRRFAETSAETSDR